MSLELVLCLVFLCGAVGFPVNPALHPTTPRLRMSPMDQATLISFVSGQCVGVSCAIVFSQKRDVYKNMLLALRELISLVDLWPTDL